MRNIVCTAAILMISLALEAIPARQGRRQLTQPDGTVITAYAHGDEHLSWFTDNEGNRLEKDKNGYYRRVAPYSDEEIAFLRSQSPYLAPQEVQTAVPLNIAPRGLVILAEFTDVKFTTDRATIDTMLIGENFTREYQYTYNGLEYDVKSSGSARQYFLTSSNGQYEPQFDIVGPVTVSKAMDYYGSNTPRKDANVQELIKEACEKAAEQGADFSIYDNNNDGYVDFVYVIYAGYGEADGGPENTIWPHKGYVANNLRLNGKRIRMYACGNEMNFYSKRYFGIGQFCHEFGHVLGLPDIYSTNSYSNTKTLGEWDIMDYGPYNNDGNTPPSYSAYERFFCGWLTPRVLNEPENVTLEELQTTNEALIITEDGTHNLKGNDPYPLVFYTLENRQQTGWNKACPGHGLLITRIDYNYSIWNQNTVNYKATEMHIDIMEADGLAPDYPDEGWYGKPTDLFPAAATQYKGIEGCPITNIKETDGVISFLFKGGAPTTDLQTAETSNENKIILLNSQVQIHHNGEIYTILGNRIK